MVQRSIKISKVRFVSLCFTISPIRLFSSFAARSPATFGLDSLPLFGWCKRFAALFPAIACCWSPGNLRSRLTAFEASCQRLLSFSLTIVCFWKPRSPWSRLTANEVVCQQLLSFQQSLAVGALAIFGLDSLPLLGGSIPFTDGKPATFGPVSLPLRLAASNCSFPSNRPFLET